jgi:hypothetical protein
MSQPRDNRHDDPPLKEIINLRHPVRLAGEMDWDFLAGRFRSVCRGARAAAVADAAGGWAVIADLEKLTGVAVRRIHGDKGYRGHNHPDRFKVWITGQVRRVTKAIRREMRRRAAIEPVIGHLKDDHRLRRNHLKGRNGDRINAMLAAAGYNFSLLLRWFEELLRALFLILWRAVLAPESQTFLALTAVAISAIAALWGYAIGVRYRNHH